MKSDILDYLNYYSLLQQKVAYCFVIKARELLFILEATGN